MYGEVGERVIREDGSVLVSLGISVNRECSCLRARSRHPLALYKPVGYSSKSVKILGAETQV